MADAAVCACAVFVVAYAAFRWAQPRIIAAVTPRPVEDFMFWAEWAAKEFDGLEVPVAFAGIIACVALCFAWVRRGFARRVLSFVPVRFVVALAALWIVFGIRSGEFSYAPRASILLGAFGVLVAACVWLRPGILASRWIGVSALGVLALVVVGVCVGTIGQPSLFDYGYFIGPALKWHHGEALGSFYMQYSTLGLLVTSALMRLDLQINGMQLALVCVSIAWFAMEWWMARELIRDRALRALFLIVLVAFRLLWLRCNIAAVPQVTPLRMELWVPLVLVARKCGMTSPWTAACCGILYALDGLFGFFFAGVYAAFTALELWSTRRGGLPSIARLAGIVAPLALALAFNLVLFGSPIASSGSRYMDAKLGFLPIDPASLFWAVFLLILLSVVAIARDDSGRRFGMFVVAITIAQLIYFLGRSHDHNLVNIGSAWITVVFLALDLELARSRRVVQLAASALLVGVLAMGAERITENLATASRGLTSGTAFETYPLDPLLDETRASWPVDTSNVILLTQIDAYVNYRLGLRQHGPLSPIYAHVLVEETAAWLCDELEHGQRVLLPGQDLPNAREMCVVLDGARCMTERKLRFDVRPSGNTPYLELALQR